MHTAVNVLWNWLAIENKPLKSDIIFLFGGAVIDIPQKGAELYDSKLSDRIVTVGNTGTFGNPEWTKPIAEVFADYLAGHGVPRSAIFVQNTSMNTLEDVTHALPLLDAEGIKHRTVVLVSRPIHQRRAYATYIKQDPNATTYNIPCDEPHPNKLKGEAFADVALRCAQEYERLIAYAEKGDICAQPAPQEVCEAYETVKATLPAAS